MNKFLFGIDRKKKNRAQVAIETTVAIVAILTFLLGATQFFIWVNQQLVNRHIAYQDSRIALGGSWIPGIDIDWQTFTHPEDVRDFVNSIDLYRRDIDFYEYDPDHYPERQFDMFDLAGSQESEN